MEAGMALFTWNSSYSVGVATIDQQHQQLMTLINELNEAMLQGKGRQMVGDILGKLIRYTGTHFADEEKLLMDHDYPEYAEHKAKHTKMVGKVKPLQQDVDAGKMTVSADVMKFLQDWLDKHIKGTDMKYGPFLNAKGIHSALDPEREQKKRRCPRHLLFFCAMALPRLRYGEN
jgi:hemerythrin